MLEEITIRGLGVIEQARLEPAPGLTVLTGETGAGKTMVLAGLDLLLGGRGDAALVRPGAARLQVDGRVRVGSDGQLRTALEQAGVELDDDAALLLSRSVSVDGRSRTWLGGRPVPAGVVAELAELVVAVHGQSSQHRLLRPAEQRAALDRFAGPPVTKALAAYRSVHSRWQAAGGELAALDAAAAERTDAAARLREELDRIEAVDPQPDEDERLQAELGRLEHAETLRAAADAAHVLLTGESPGSGPDGEAGADVRASVANAVRSLQGGAGHDPALGELAELLAGLGYQLAEVTERVAAYASAVDSDPAGLAARHERLAALAGVARPHGSLAATLDWLAGASDRLLELDRADERRDALLAEVAALREQLTGHAAQLSRLREQAARRFAAAVGAELAELAMAGARVGVSVSRRAVPDGLEVAGQRVAFGADGVDEVELTLAAHPGAPERPLARAASGGELSRVMLAVEVVFAGADPVPTMVFDEVDSGVGGAAAVEVGRRLARLARDHQVLCVTHLAQVAAFADRHLHVSKDATGAVTSATVRVLDDAARLRELSRMLGGLADSELGQGHAEELLALAASARS